MGEVALSVAVRCSVFGVVQGVGTLAALLAAVAGGGVGVICAVLVVAAVVGLVIGDRAVRPGGAGAAGPSPAPAPHGVYAAPNVASGKTEILG
ncbi:hypothetical protein DY467_07565 [Rhodopseudomonas sp. BR0G17]|nr:hypothetical protein [Rhodopseudomonas sp. BR0G17]